MRFLSHKRIVINIHAVAGDPEKQLRVFSRFKGDTETEALFNLNASKENPPVFCYFEIARHALTSFHALDCAECSIQAKSWDGKYCNILPDSVK